MNYNFDEIINRNGTACEKWDPQYLQDRFGTTDIIPMWVADLDFRSPPTVMDALQKRIEHGVFGYTFRDKKYFDAVTSWVAKRHNWALQPEWIEHSPGVVPAIALLIRALTSPKDKIVIQSPVYHHFAKAIHSSERSLVDSPLVYKNGTYEIDYQAFEEVIKDAKLFILCNPHNPVGRVWTKDELTKVGEICLKYHVPVISDEIHCDMIFAPNKFTAFASISEVFANHSITCMSPSKTFNLQGMQMSTVIIPNAQIRQKYTTILNSLVLGNPTPMGLVALESVYNTGEDWLDAVLAYLKENVEYTVNFFEKNIPEIKVTKPEGTYMLWLNCQGLNMNREQLDKFMLYEAKIAMNEGHIFGENGSGFMRMNIGCSRILLKQALNQLLNAVKLYRK